jgi:hypothetical protein
LGQFIADLPPVRKGQFVWRLVSSILMARLLLQQRPKSS